MTRARDPLTEAVVRLADGDRAAFEPVYTQAQPRVLDLVRRLLRGDPEAEDVAQTALIRVFERAGAFDPAVGPALPWILGVATWECRTHSKKRQRSRERATEAVPEQSCSSEGPEATAIDRDLERALDALIATLEPTDRQALRAFLEQIERPAIAPATFRKRLQRALERLKSAWRAEHG